VSSGATLDTGSPIIRVTARIDDRGNGSLAIAGAEVYLDQFPWEGGTPVPLGAVDGSFDSTLEAVWGTMTLTTTVTDYTQSRHMALVRGRDISGAWGPFTAAYVSIPHLLFLPLLAHSN
jgi:hypothetical protein